MIWKNADVDFNDKNNDNFRFVKVNFMPALGEHLEAEFYVDQAISNSVNEPSLVTTNRDNDFNNFKLTNIEGNTLNSQAVNDVEVISKPYVDNHYQETERPRRDLGLDFYNQSSDFSREFKDNKSTNLDSIPPNRNRCSGNELANKKTLMTHWAVIIC